MNAKHWAFGGAFFAFFFLLSPLDASAQTTPPVTGPANCGALQNIAGVCVPTTASTGLSSKPVADIIMAFMNWILAIFGFIAIVGFVISGLQYLLSTGDEGMAETAKRNMMYCIIGIVVALSAWVIIQAIDKALNATPFF